MARWKKLGKRIMGVGRKVFNATPLGGAINMFRGLKGGGGDEDSGGGIAGAVERDVSRSGGDAAVNFRSKYQV